MEFSSPLAAMRPQPCPTWTRSGDMDASFSIFPSFQPIQSKFNFRDMSMNQQKPVSRDYFSTRPVRGSSPTSSLTADLDANFHIDKSPQVVTPRRSLFTANILHSNLDVRVSTPPIVEDATTTGTPMVPSSSPGIDMMDVSPLPHKPAFIAQVTLPSPTPDETPQETMPSPHLFPSSNSQYATTSQTLQLPERRRPVTRPSLSRAKGWSTSSVLQRPASASNELPPFCFGNVATGALTSASVPSLVGSLSQSPVEMPTPDAAFSHPRRPSLGTSRNSGSPCFSHIRKPSSTRPPFSRPPRKQMRRSLSMFQHPDEVMKEEQEVFDAQPPPLMSMIEVDVEHTLKLPHFIPDGEPDSLPRITQDTMLDVLNNRYADKYQNVLIVDCRFEYEYEGGHIENAINYNDKQLLSDKLFAEPSHLNTLIIFHCEYSVHRAPLTAKFIRNHDRKLNAINYPSLTYPELYILDGGYSRFFATHRSKCQPQNYVEMSDLRHEQACERGMARVKQRQKLFRNQTFAFGQSDDCMDDSPTQNPIRNGLCQRSQSTFDVGPDIAGGIGEKFQRRMASY